MQQKLKEKEEVYNKLKSLAMKSKKEAGQLKSRVSQLYTLSMCKIQGKSPSTLSKCKIQSKSTSTLSTNVE